MIHSWPFMLLYPQIDQTIQLLKNVGKREKEESPTTVVIVGDSLWCPGRDSNPHTSRHTHLKRARLPIPPPGRVALRNSFCV